MDRRPLSQHLRLLPGGDASLGAALAVTVVLYGMFFMGGGIIALIAQEGLKVDLGVGGVFSVANALPFGVLLFWTGMRVRGTKAIGLDEAGVDLAMRRVHYGDDVGRVPQQAVVLSIRPRQVRVELRDGRPLTVFFRVNADPEDLLGLAQVMREHDGLAVEDWVRERLLAHVFYLLPDVEGVREALASEVLPLGIVVTRTEVA